jgi:DNA-binding MarR family transcriptional regulator
MPGPRRRGRRSHPAGRASLGVVTVDPDFGQEYPDGDATSTQAHATLVRTGQALISELDRRIAHTFGMPQAAAMTLAVLDGAGQPLTPSEISERLLVASATMTATLDLLEHRGWIRRTPNPDDRRSVLVQITAEGQATADQMLPGIRELERRAMSGLSKDEKAQLLDLLARVLKNSAELAAQPPEPLKGRRNRPSRLPAPPS